MLYFVTENQPKLHNANIILKSFGLHLTGKPIHLTEIQTDSLEEIALYKAKQAYEKIKEPLVVKDDGWYITALQGFPGVYMKYMNEWLTVNDFLNLLKPYKNRGIIFKEALCYIDKNQHKIFVNTIEGKILKKPTGKSVPMATLATFRKDGKTMAECINEGIHFADIDATVWNDFAQWYKTR